MGGGGEGWGGGRGGGGGGNGRKKKEGEKEKKRLSRNCSCATIRGNSQQKMTQEKSKNALLYPDAHNSSLDSNKGTLMSKVIKLTVLDKLTQLPRVP